MMKYLKSHFTDWGIDFRARKAENHMKKEKAGKNQVQLNDRSVWCSDSHVLAVEY